jgi:signal peptide peptidase SppA
VKKNRLRGLRSAIGDLFAESMLAIHEPALPALLSVLDWRSSIDVESLQARVGMGSGDEPTMRTIGNVAVLPIQGVISQKANWLTRALGWTASEQLERDFLDAMGNSQVKAIAFYVDSPGGTALGNEETSRTMFAKRGEKPVYAFVRGMCCSAAYYLASPAKQMFASPSSLVGSIGAVSTHIEYSRALTEMGIGATVIRSAPHKQLWNQFEKLSPEGKASLQKMVSDYGDQFEQAVARYRGISQAQVKAKYGQGDAFVAAEAHSRGLVDGVMSWNEFLGKVQGATSVAGSPASSIGSSVQGLSQRADSFAPAIAASSSSPELSAPVSLAGIPAPQGQADGGTHTSTSEKTTVKISAKVRAALFARGLIAAQDAEESVCIAARDAFFTARGEACPQEDEKVVAALFATHAVAAAAAPLNPAGGTPAAQPNNVQAAHDREIAEARQAARQDEVTRQKEIRASGKLLNLDQASIDAAIEGGKPFAEVVTAWHTQLADKEKPIAPRADVKVGEEAATRYVADAVLATMIHFGQGDNVPKEKITPQIEQLSRAPLHVHALKCLQAAGIRVDDEYDREEVCKAAFEMDAGRQVIRADGGIAYNRPGSFPNLLSGLANKLLDDPLEDAETSYEEYTGVWPGDLPDFKPVPVISKGRIGELDEVLDAEEFKEQGLAEECLSSMQLSRFGNKAGLTPVLAANDDLGAFMDDLWGLKEGWELTQNRGCLRLVTSNAYLLDGTQLFDDTNHLNHIASGGAAPSDSEWDKMTIKASKQTTIGGKSYAAVPLGVILCPPALFRGAAQSFWKFNSIGESKQAATDSNLSVYRGMVTVVKEPELAATSEVEWYGLTRPGRKAAIVRAYFRGFGRKGKRERWYDPNTKVYWISLEARFGAAVRQYRYAYKNKGAA